MCPWSTHLGSDSALCWGLRTFRAEWRALGGGYVGTPMMKHKIITNKDTLKWYNPTSVRSMDNHSGELVKVTVLEHARNFYEGFFVKVNLQQPLEEERLLSKAVRVVVGWVQGEKGEVWQEQPVGVAEQRMQTWARKEVRAFTGGLERHRKMTKSCEGDMLEEPKFKIKLRTGKLTLLARKMKEGWGRWAQCLLALRKVRRTWKHVLCLPLGMVFSVYGSTLWYWNPNSSSLPSLPLLKSA